MLSPIVGWMVAIYEILTEYDIIHIYIYLPTILGTADQICKLKPAQPVS